MRVLRLESFDSKISEVFCSRSSSLSLSLAAAEMAELEGTRCVEGNADSRNDCLFTRGQRMLLLC